MTVHIKSQRTLRALGAAYLSSPPSPPISWEAVLEAMVALFGSSPFSVSFERLSAAL